MVKSNLILIGMPGAGKSTVGVLAAKALGMAFIDTDLLIQEREGRLLQEIIDCDGIERFLAVEEDVILKLGDINSSVVATGGSVVYSRAGMASLRANGLLVYLQLPYDELKKRIMNMTARGIVIGRGQTLWDLYNERILLYERYADVNLNCFRLSVEEVVERICRLWKEQKNAAGP